VSVALSTAGFANVAAFESAAVDGSCRAASMAPPPTTAMARINRLISVALDPNLEPIHEEKILHSQPLIS
jgi:hypothetical protein